MMILNITWMSELLKMAGISPIAVHSVFAQRTTIQLMCTCKWVNILTVNRLCSIDVMHLHGCQLFLAAKYQMWCISLTKAAKKGYHLQRNQLFSLHCEMHTVQVSVIALANPFCNNAQCTLHTLKLTLMDFAKCRAYVFVSLYCHDNGKMLLSALNTRQKPVRVPLEPNLCPILVSLSK